MGRKVPGRNSQGNGKSNDEEKARMRRRYLVTKKRDIDFYHDSILLFDNCDC